MKYIKQITLCGVLGIAVLPFNSMGTQIATKAAHEITGSESYKVPETIPLYQGNLANVTATSGRKFDLVCRGKCQLAGGDKLSMTTINIPNLVKFSTSGGNVVVNSLTEPVCTFKMPGGHNATVGFTLSTLAVGDQNTTVQNAIKNRIYLELIQRQRKKSTDSPTTKPAIVSTKYLFIAKPGEITFPMTSEQTVEFYPRLSSAVLSSSTGTPSAAADGSNVSAINAGTGDNKELDLSSVFRVLMSITGSAVTDPNT